MKKLYSTIMMLAMIVAALSFAACSSSSDDDEDFNHVKSLLEGTWEVVDYSYYKNGESITHNPMFSDEITFYKHYMGQQWEFSFDNKGFKELDGLILTPDQASPFKLEGNIITSVYNEPFFYINELTPNKLILRMEWWEENKTKYYEEIITLKKIVN